MESPGYHFQDIYKEYHPKILRYIEKLAGHAQAEDITQDVFLKVNQSLDQFKGKSKLSTWLYRIATHTAIDRFRASNRKSAIKSVAMPDVPNNEIQHGRIQTEIPSIDQQVIQKEMNECIREFIQRLPTDYKTVLLLSEYEGLKNREIAEILDISIDNVKIRLHRARMKLKEELNRGCEFYHDENNVLACDRKNE